MAAVATLVLIADRRIRIDVDASGALIAPRSGVIPAGLRRAWRRRPRQMMSPKPIPLPGTPGYFGIGGREVTLRSDPVAYLSSLGPYLTSHGIGFVSQTEGDAR